MIVTPPTYRRPRGLGIALMGLAIADLLLCVTGVAVAAKGLDLPPASKSPTLDQMLGIAFAFLMLQILLRLGALAVRALWTRQLVRNAHLFHVFPISPLWAWAGFFVPVASLWLPGRITLALANADGHRPQPLGGLCLLWAIARWLTCPSGGVFTFAVLVTIAAYREVVLKLAANSTRMIMVLTLVMAVAGIVSAVAGMVIVAWIARRQPRPGQLRHAEVF